MKPRIDSMEFMAAISVNQMREYDAYTIANYTPGRTLMYRAAKGVFDSYNWEGKKIAIIAGSGNNGGDGYALATILFEHGMDVSIFRTSGKLSSDGAYYLNEAKRNNIPIEYFEIEMSFSEYDVLVDCILGTGFSGIPREPVASAIKAINKSNAYIISVDINSGMNGDTGDAELAVHSNLTVSIGFYKRGLFLGKAMELIDDLVNVDIGIIIKDKTNY